MISSGVSQVGPQRRAAFRVLAVGNSPAEAERLALARADVLATDAEWGRWRVRTGRWIPTFRSGNVPFPQQFTCILTIERDVEKEALDNLLVQPISRRTTCTNR